MEEIINKAIEGGLKEGEKWQFQTANNYWALWLDGNKNEATVDVKHYMMSKDFWQALSKACGWEEKQNCSQCGDVWEKACWCDRYYTNPIDRKLYYARNFYEINLTQGFDSAVAWLSDLIDKS